MKVAFWSNVRGKCGTTSNMACISVMSALEQEEKNILLENHYNLNNLDNAFVNRQWKNMVREEQYYYNQIGLDSLMKKLHSNLIDFNLIAASSIALLGNQIHYIPQSHITNKEFFEYEFNQVVHPLLKVLEEFGDAVYIDTASSEHLSSKVILEEADIVVVNLSQEQVCLEDYFSNYSSLTEKAVYLIGNYNKDSKFNQKNIMRKYQINKDKIGVIPYNIEFRDSFSNGSVIKFLSRNYGLTKKEENYYFIQKLREASLMLHREIMRIKKEQMIV